jgi:ribonuclease HI
MNDMISSVEQSVIIEEGQGPSPASDITVGFDGLMEPVNPGGIGVGAFVIRENGVVVRRMAVLAGKPGDTSVSNNVAEYTGIVSALEYLVSIGFKGKVMITGDSKIVINQVNGAFEVHSQNLLPFHSRAHSLMMNLRNNGASVSVKWVPRERNEDADSATRDGFATFLKNFKGSASICHNASPPDGKAAKVISCDSLTRKGEDIFEVPSSVSDEVYEVDISDLTCTCKYFQNRHRPCKHITLVIDCMLDKNMRTEKGDVL